MKILFDQGTPVPLRRHLTEHVVDTAFERGWSNLENGELLDAAERDGYGLLITTDQNLKYQQNLGGRQLAILVLLSTSWPRIQLRIDDIQAAVDGIGPGDYTEIPI
jgi:predicted nuclease of predicted toxin-antitoxin system